MPRFISATYHANIKVAEFICDDGRHLLRCGGTLPWRLNNAGDLMSPVDTNGLPAPRKTKNFIGFAAVQNKKANKLSHLFIFPDYESGREQMALSIRRLYASKTLPQLVEKYAPPDGSNNTAKYTADLLKESGVESHKTISELTESEFKKVLDKIEKIEGYHNEADTRKEVWVPVSRITATDGARPLADEEVVLRIEGNDTILKTNQYGQLPPIPHSNGQHVEVLHKQANGEVKSVGAISGDHGQHFSLKTWVQRFWGMPGPDKAPDQTHPRRAAVAYTVQANDTLSKLAAQFKTSTAQIKRDNGLKRDVIFVGQQLGIYGPLVKGLQSPPAANKAEPKANKNAKDKPAPPAKNAAKAARTKLGTGQPVALVRADQRMAPWMAVAFREATTFAGKDEKEITKTHNYHRLVTDSDRAGGRVVALKDKKGKPLLDKDGKPMTKRTFGGSYDTLAGDGHPWCASFVNYCLKEAGYAPGRRHMSSYTFGEDNDLFVRVKAPVYGAVRFSKRVGGGHVCFVYGVAGGKLVTIGGNQGDQICFELTNFKAKGEAFFVPLVYKEFAEMTGAVLPDVDVDALRKEFGAAVKVNDDQINANDVTTRSQR